MNNHTENSTDTQFPQYLHQRKDVPVSGDPFFGDLPGLRRANGWEWDKALLRGNPDGEVSAGAEFAAHYVKLLKDSDDATVDNVLGADLLPILNRAPRGVQIGFFSTIERLLTDHAPEPFETIKAYEREDSEYLNAEHEPTKENGVEEQRGLDSKAALAALAAIGRHSQSDELESDIKRLVTKHDQATPTDQGPARLMKGASASDEWKPESLQPFHDSGLFDILAIPEKLDTVPDELFHAIFHLSMAAIVSGDACAINAASDLMCAAAEIAKRADSPHEARKVERLNDLVGLVSLDLSAAESLELFGHTDSDYDYDGAQKRLRQCLFELGKADA